MAPGGHPAAFAPAASVGVSTHYQFATDVCAPLSVDQLQVKLTFLAERAARLVRDVAAERHVGTESVRSCERFLRMSGAEATRMHALLHSIEPGASLAFDPWDFQRSPYEHERLESTAEWISGHLSPRDGSVVEVGSCEGALTSRLRPWQ